MCNINHASYYHECLDKAREELDAQGRGTEGNKRALAEQLINEGIYPSLGEREKAIFSTSPVTDGKQNRPPRSRRTVTVADVPKTEKMHEIEQFRSLDAALTGSKGKKGQPVEEVDIVGADIAV